MDAHEHRWVLVSAVLDGKGSLRVHRCEECGAEAVQPATGDAARRPDLHGNG